MFVLITNFYINVSLLYVGKKMSHHFISASANPVSWQSPRGKSNKKCLGQSTDDSNETGSHSTPHAPR